MTPEEIIAKDKEMTSKLVDIMTSYLRGETIEYRTKDKPDEVWKILRRAYWNNEILDYRVGPKHYKVRVYVIRGTGGQIWFKVCSETQYIKCESDEVILSSKIVELVAGERDVVESEETKASS